MADLWNKIKNIVGTSAPILGNAIIPGFGGAAGSLVAKALGCDPNKPEDIEKILSANKESLLKLKEIETKHEEFLLNLGFENDKLYIQDTQNARQREVEVTKATGKTNWGLYALAGVVTLSFIIILIILFKIPIIAMNKDVVVYAVGGIQGCFIMVVSYFFGSSKGSNDKNDILLKSAQTKGDTK